jgi:cysteinyl-tRNA synthetase
MLDGVQLECGWALARGEGGVYFGMLVRPALGVQGVKPRDLARRYEGEFWNDMEALGVTPPVVCTRVTEHVDAIISFVTTVIDNGLAYVPAGGDGVYFDTQAFVAAGHVYGKLGGGGISDPTITAQEPEPMAFKRDPRDFALWKIAKPGEAWWDSPWGKGRPGWHIECSAMIRSVFGPGLDVHGGGVDLKYVQYWLRCVRVNACPAVPVRHRAVAEQVSVIPWLDECAFPHA